MRAAALTLSIGALLIGLSVSGCLGRAAASRRSGKRADEQAARTAATEWLQLLDNREYTDAYEREPTRLRAGGTRAQFIRSMKLRRAPFGRANARTFIGAAASRKLTGAPDAEYESVLFRTSFEHKQAAAERVILTREREVWRVVDYRLY